MPKKKKKKKLKKKKAKKKAKINYKQIINQNVFKTGDESKN